MARYTKQELEELKDVLEFAAEHADLQADNLEPTDENLARHAYLSWLAERAETFRKRLDSDRFVIQVADGKGGYREDLVTVPDRG